MVFYRKYFLLCAERRTNIVVPAKAGTQVLHALTIRQQTWVPASAGTTLTMQHKDYN